MRDELEYVLKAYDNYIFEYLGTKEIAISLFANSQEFFDSCDSVDTLVNQGNLFKITTYHDFSIGTDNVLTDINYCEVAGLKVINIITPFTRDKMYDFIVASAVDMKKVLGELDRRREHRREKEIDFPVIGIDFEKIEKEIVNFLLNEEFRTFCKERNIPLKRGIIFEGPPGNGKTLTLKYLRNKALSNDIAFTSIDSPKDFIERADTYFDDGKNIFVFEDFDNIVQDRDGGAPNQVLGKLLNTLEGVNEVSNTVSIFTTNKIGLFDEAFIRPGRIDKVIRFDLPNDEDKKSFLETYLSASSDFLPLGKDVSANTNFILDLLGTMSGNVSYAILKGICDDIHIFTFNKGSLTKNDITGIIKEKMKGANRNTEVKSTKEYIL